MLQRLLIHSAVNVFESARFIIGYLWLLIGYTIVREFIQEISVGVLG